MPHVIYVILCLHKTTQWIYLPLFLLRGNTRDIEYIEHSSFVNYYKVSFLLPFNPKPCQD